jgi:DNA-directed RNA polymerase subunit M/transcription elongation factor TFIIS
MEKQDKKQKYIVQREDFKKKKAGLLEQISEHSSTITKLNQQIEEERPKTENGSMICGRCDCVSMKYLGRTPRGGLSGGDDFYECEICGKSNFSQY